MPETFIVGQSASSCAVLFCVTSVESRCKSEIKTLNRSGQAGLETDCKLLHSSLFYFETVMLLFHSGGMLIKINIWLEIKNELHIISTKLNRHVELPVITGTKEMLTDVTVPA